MGTLSSNRLEGMLRILPSADYARRASLSQCASTLSSESLTTLAFLACVSTLLRLVDGLWREREWEAFIVCHVQKGESVGFPMAMTTPKLLKCTLTVVVLLMMILSLC